VQSPSEEAAAAHGVRHGMVFAAMPNAAALAQAAQWIDAGRFRVEVTTVLPLRDARRGHELSETKHTRGKIALQA